MIYPTQRAVLAVGLAAPAAVAIGVLSPQAWTGTLLWVLLITILILADAVLAPATRPEVVAPAAVQVGETAELTPLLPGHLAAEVTPPLEPLPGRPLAFHAARRGTARLRRLWSRATGPLGLAWRQASVALDRPIRILPDLRPVREQGMRQVLRAHNQGQRMRREVGDGSEFQALTDFQPGMERRTIDWRASARHGALIAREFRTERENAIVFAIDCGRAMSGPVGDVPRIDRAVSAALLAAFVALKSGDRVRLYSFAARPQGDSGSLRGASAFATLHRTAAEIDYCEEETNHTLSLVTLDTRLDRRSLVVLFTEFTDPTGAELLLAATGRILKRHRLICVLFHDLELDTIVARRPESADDVIRANVAHALIRERRIVIERLRRLGIEVLESGPDELSLALVDCYLKHRERA